MQNQPIDVYGICPNCKEDWDGEEIIEAISKMDIYMSKPQSDIVEVASKFGHTSANRKRFTNLKIIEIQGNMKTAVQCKNCLHVWDKDTHEHFDSFESFEKSLHERNSNYSEEE